MPLITKQSAPANAQDVILLPGRFPGIPDEIKQRFDSASTWNDDIDSWWRVTTNAFNDFGRSNADAVNQSVATGVGDIILRLNGFSVALQQEKTARITADEALGRWLISVSAIASSSQNISVQSSAPGSPSINDLWVNSSDLLNPITYFWSGSAWVEQGSFVLAAAVSDERTARVTADGFLEGKYSLTVIAGDVVTGMNITSASGPGTNISSVIFRATDFKIFNGTSGITMFSVSGSNVNLAGTLTVSTSGKVFTGTGSYGNSNTPFYVDSTLFSLGNKLTWDSGTGTLTITGSISATTGTIGGWTVGATTLTGGNATLSSTGVLTLGTTNDVVVLSAVDSTYRIWIGNTAAASAAFSVTKAGLLTSTAGTIGGWTIGATTLSNNTAILDSAGQLLLGTSNDVIIISATNATYRMWAGNATAGSASFSITKTGALFSTSGTVGGWTIGASSLTATNIALAASGTSGIIVGDYTSTNSYALLAYGGSFDGFQIYSAGVRVLRLRNSSGGLLTLADAAGTTNITLTGSSGNIDAQGNISAFGTITATTFFSGPGSAITSLNGSNISSGTVAPARLGTGSGGSTKFLREDSTWQTISGTGDVVGPSSATDNALARFDTTTGKLIQNSVATVDDSGNAIFANIGGTVITASTSVGIASGGSLTGASAGIIATTAVFQANLLVSVDNAIITGANKGVVYQNLNASDNWAFKANGANVEIYKNGSLFKTV